MKYDPFSVKNLVINCLILLAFNIVFFKYAEEAQKAVPFFIVGAVGVWYVSTKVK